MKRKQRGRELTHLRWALELSGIPVCPSFALASGSRAHSPLLSLSLLRLPVLLYIAVWIQFLGSTSVWVEFEFATGVWHQSWFTTAVLFHFGSGQQSFFDFDSQWQFEFYSGSQISLGSILVFNGRLVSVLIDTAGFILVSGSRHQSGFKCYYHISLVPFWPAHVLVSLHVYNSSLA